MKATVADKKKLQKLTPKKKTLLILLKTQMYSNLDEFNRMNQRSKENFNTSTHRNAITHSKTRGIKKKKKPKKPHTYLS